MPPLCRRLRLNILRLETTRQSLQQDLLETPGHLVLSLLPREADFLEAVRRLARRIESA